MWSLSSRAEAHTAGILKDTEKTYSFCLTELAAFVLPAPWKELFGENTLTLKLSGDWGSALAAAELPSLLLWGLLSELDNKQLLITGHRLRGLSDRQRTFADLQQSIENTSFKYSCRSYTNALPLNSPICSNPFKLSKLIAHWTKIFSYRVLSVTYAGGRDAFPRVPLSSLQPISVTLLTFRLGDFVVSKWVQTGQESKRPMYFKDLDCSFTLISQPSCTLLKKQVSLFWLVTIYQSFQYLLSRTLRCLL